MRNWKRSRGGAALVAAVALLALGASREASAHPHGHVVFHGGFYYGGFYPGWGYGFGWGPYWGWGWGPYPYYSGAPEMGAAMVAGMGAVELKVKPNKADVWVDNRYVGEARDLDGYPNYLWLSDGPHKLAVYMAGYKVFQEDIDVRRGMKSDLKVKLEPGESSPPGEKPGRPEDKAPKSKDDKSKDQKPKDDKPKDDKPPIEMNNDAR
jgi:hypothetical protein